MILYLVVSRVGKQKMKIIRGIEKMERIKGLKRIENIRKIDVKKGSVYNT